MVIRITVSFPLKPVVLEIELLNCYQVFLLTTTIPAAGGSCTELVHGNNCIGVFDSVLLV